jgi:hypothetical protein
MCIIQTYVLHIFIFSYKHKYMCVNKRYLYIHSYITYVNKYRYLYLCDLGLRFLPPLGLAFKGPEELRLARTPSILTELFLSLFTLYIGLLLENSCFFISGLFVSVLTRTFPSVLTRLSSLFVSVFALAMISSTRSLLSV